MLTAPTTPLPASAAEIIPVALPADQCVLLVGAPGIGKSTLVNALARALAGAGRDCWCIGADPGSPLFGIPGAVCLGRWSAHGWELIGLEALCSLDAGRFRLPLVSAVTRLTRKPLPGVLLIDAPGVVRGVAGAELLTGIVDTADVDVVLALARQDRPPPLAQELPTLPAKVFFVQAAAEARRPGRGARARERTRLWQNYLAQAGEHHLHLEKLRLLGTPPPTDVPSAWTGRQLALVDGTRTLAMGEVVALDGTTLQVRRPDVRGTATAVLVRDAQRGVDGCLGTATRFARERLEYLPPPDMVPPPPAGTLGGPRVVGRVGNVDVSLVNGVFGDPLLHVRLRHQRRSLLFDLGEGARLAARVAHQVSDVFITHAHIDHIAGFLWLLRSRIGEFPACRIYGPPGLAENIAGLVQGILWDRVADRGPQFEVFELDENRLRRFQVQAGIPGYQILDERSAPDGMLWRERSFCVRAVTLNHVSPVLAFALQPAEQLNVRKDRLIARGLTPGAWLGELKQSVQAQQLDTPVQMPNGQVQTAGELAADLLLRSPGKKLVYATDLSDSPENRSRLIALARGAHTMFCEAAFVEADAEQAARTAHLTTRACGEIAEAAGVARLVPIHFSRRYEHDVSRIYDEIAEVCSRVVTPPQN